jgi:hypothetical protein
MARRPKIPLSQEDLSRYNEMVNHAMASTMSAHSTMSDIEDLVHNRDRGRLWGNLVSNFARMLAQRTRPSNYTIVAQSRDPQARNLSSNLTVVCNSIVDASGLFKEVATAAQDAVWAGCGVVEFGHPQDPNVLDPMRSFKAKHTPSMGSQDLSDRYVPVSKEQVFGAGVDPMSVATRDAQYIEDNLDDSAHTAPILQATSFPWVARVNPYMVVFPSGAKGTDYKSFAWFGRLRWISLAELKLLTGVDYSPGCMYSTLWEKEGTGVDWVHTKGQMVLIIEVHIRRDFVKPDLNGWTFSYIVGRHTDGYISRYKGSFFPFEILTLDKYSNSTDPSVAQEVEPYARLYGAGMSSIAKDLNNSLNSPIGVRQGTDLDSKSESAITDPKSSVVIKNIEPDSIFRVYQPGQFNQDLLRMMLFIKSGAQAQTNTSQLDEGIPVGSITAHQSQALLDATGIAMSSARENITEIIKRSTIKLIHLVETSSEATRSGMKFAWGGRAANWSWTDRDIVSSYSFDVRPSSVDDRSGQEDLLMLNQFVGLVSKEQRLGEEVDWKAMLLEMMTRNGLPMDLILSEQERLENIKVQAERVRQATLAAGGGGGGGGMDQQGLPAGAPSPQGLPFGQDGGMQAPFAGEHPERELGSRGTGQSVAHALGGLSAKQV